MSEPLANINEEQQDRKDIACPDCGGQNISYQAVSEIVPIEDKIKRTSVMVFSSIMWAIGLALSISGVRLYVYSAFYFLWMLLLFIPKNIKTIVCVYAVCQNCGARWGNDEAMEGKSKWVKTYLN